MKKFKVVKHKYSSQIYKCWLWTIHDENGIWIGKTYKNIPPYFASKEKAEKFLMEVKTNA